jgi:hypothetical protein
VLVYLPVIQNEQQHLRNLFADYADYAAHVPILWPRLKPFPQRKLSLFRLSLYLKNQEYNAGAGFTAGMLFLFWKWLK